MNLHARALETDDRGVMEQDASLKITPTIRFKQWLPYKSLFIVGLALMGLNLPSQWQIAQTYSYFLLLNDVVHATTTPAS